MIMSPGVCTCRGRTFSSLESLLVLSRCCLCRVLFQGSFFPTILNFLPNDKILDLSNLKACADDKVNVTQEIKFVEITYFHYNESRTIPRFPLGVY